MSPATTKVSEREAALKAYQACASEAERAELYWRMPLLQEIFSAATHPKAGGARKTVETKETRRIL